MDDVAETQNLQKSVLKSIPVERLKRGRYQPRNDFPEDALDLLAETIKKFGVLEPLLVRPLSVPGTYEIVAGERRWRAAQKVCLAEVPCLIGLYSDEKAAQIAFIENDSRQDLNPIESARAINKIIDEFDYTHEEAGAILGKKRTQITNLLRLLKLDGRVQEFLIAGKLQESHGKILAGVDVVYQNKLAIQCIEKQWSMRMLEKAVKDLFNGSARGKTARENSKKDVHTLYLEKHISDQLGHPTEIVLDDSGKAGYVKIPFKTLEQLDSINKRLGYKKDRFD